MDLWTKNYIEGLLREREDSRRSGDKERESAVNRQLAAYGHKDADKVDPAVEVAPEDVEQARSAPPKNRGGRPRQTAAE